MREARLCARGRRRCIIPPPASQARLACPSAAAVGVVDQVADEFQQTAGGETIEGIAVGQPVADLRQARLGAAASAKALDNAPAIALNRFGTGGPAPDWANRP